ncbi:MAG TPA: VPLPA-CTERM sorting domain-containing protein [Methylophilus sp.]
MRAQTIRRRSSHKNRNPLRKAKWALFSLLILVSLFAYTNAYKNPIWKEFSKPAEPSVVAHKQTLVSQNLPKVAKYQPLPEVWGDDTWVADFSPFVAGFRDADFFGEGKLVALNDQFDLPNDTVDGFLQADRIKGIDQLMQTDMARTQYFTMVNRGDSGGNNRGGGAGASGGAGGNGGGRDNSSNNPSTPLIIGENEGEADNDSKTPPPLIVADHSDAIAIDVDTATSAVPLPAAVWLFASAMCGLFGLRRKV